LIPTTGLELKYAVTRHFNLEGSVQFAWQDTGDLAEDGANHLILGTSGLAARNWHVNLNGRCDSEIVNADNANRDLLNRIYLTVA
jgi:hypothetical protein